MKRNNFLFCFFIILNGFSQNYKGNLGAIEQDGLHKIKLTSEIRSKAYENFGFIRIKDAQKKDVPYVLMYNSDRKYSSYIPITIISKNVIKDSVTSILIENKAKKTQDHIVLKIANARVTKKYNIYGSNDGKEWFGLIANNILPQPNATDKIAVEKMISFPLNNYAFLRFDFNDKNSLPINIIAAGYYKNNYFSQTPVKLNNFNYEIVESGDKKVTTLKFTALNSHKISAISFFIKTKFFLRNAKLIVRKNRKIKKRIEAYDEVVSYFQLNSSKNNTFTIDNLNEKEFIIEIENKDNPPLTIEGIQLLQNPVYLITNLKSKEPYEFLIDTTLSKPSYDLENFISNNTNTIKELVVTTLLKVKDKKVKNTKKRFWQTNLFMWLCMILGGIVVVYFTFGLLKDMSK